MVTLADGRIVAVSRTGKVEPDPRRDLAPVTHVASSGDALAVDSRARPVAVRRLRRSGAGSACRSASPRGDDARPNAGATRELAVLQPDGATVSLFIARNANPR